MAQGTSSSVLLMMLLGWLVLSVLVVPVVAALGHAGRLQDRAARRAVGFAAEPAPLRMRA